MKAKRSIDWGAIRAAYEVGGPTATFRALATRFDLSHTYIRKHAVSEGWKQALEPDIARETAIKLAGVDSTVSEEARAEAVDSEATRRAEIIKRHRDEWNAARALIYEGAKEYAAKDVAKPAALAKLKAGKTMAEALAIIQSGERRAYNITGDGSNARTPGSKQTWLVKFVEDPYADEPEA